MYPLLICMTPVRNEAWCLEAFLRCASLWADHIIIADQNSTDGSQGIALKFPKVILINNNNPEFNEPERQRILIERARQIEGDKILFALDADEIFSANYSETEDWQRILNSKPGDVFWFRWANICPDQVHYWAPETFYPWMFHDDGKEPHKNYVKNMHSMRIPYPIEEKQMFYVNDFKVLHLAHLSTQRVEAKLRFYKFVDFEMNNRSIIWLSRNYYKEKGDYSIHDLPSEWIYNNSQSRINMFSLIVLNLQDFWYDHYITEKIRNDSKQTYNRIDIWDYSFIVQNHLTDNRSLWQKMLHYYLRRTSLFRNKMVIRAFDKLLKKLGI